MDLSLIPLGDIVEELRKRYIGYSLTICRDIDDNTHSMEYFCSGNRPMILGLLEMTKESICEGGDYGKDKHIV